MNPDSEATRRCPYCAETILAAAVKCRYCSEFMPVGSALNSSARVEAKPKWNPGIASVLSLVIPGSGQMYSGRIWQGLIWLPGVFLAYYIWPGFGLLAHAACVWNASGKLIPKVRPVEIDTALVKRVARLLAIAVAAVVVLYFVGRTATYFINRPDDNKPRLETSTGGLVFADKAAITDFISQPVDDLMKSGRVFRIENGVHLRFIDNEDGHEHITSSMENLRGERVTAKPSA